MIKIQIDRRNLTPMQLTYFRGLHYNIEKKIHGDIENLTKQSPKGQNDPSERSTANRLSEHYKVSPRTIKRDAQIADVLIAIGKESQEAKNDILLGNAGINRRQLREMASDSEEEIAKTASDIATGTFVDKNNVAESDPQKEQGSGNKNSDFSNNILLSGELPIKPGNYQHFKGNQYEVIGFAKHSETLDDMVIYRALYGENGIWVRPLSMWEESVEDESGNIIKRFEYIEQ